jgi:hypothetical protein
VARRDPDEQKLLAEVERRFFHHENEAEIARVLALTPHQMTRYVRLIRQANLARLKRPYDEKLADVLGGLHQVKRDIQEGYEITQEPREIRESSQFNGASTSQRVSYRKESPQPDPRFMEEMRQCIALEAQLLGLDKGLSGTLPPETQVEVTEIDHNEEYERIHYLLEAEGHDGLAQSGDQFPRGFPRHAALGGGDAVDQRQAV